MKISVEELGYSDYPKSANCMFKRNTNISVIDDNNVIKQWRVVTVGRKIDNETKKIIPIRLGVIWYDTKIILPNEKVIYPECPNCITGNSWEFVLEIYGDADDAAQIMHEDAVKEIINNYAMLYIEGEDCYE